MNKTELIQEIADKANGSKSEAQRYFEASEDELASACPQCAGELRSRCPACGARFSSVFAVDCEACGSALRPAEQLGMRIRKPER